MVVKCPNMIATRITLNLKERFKDSVSTNTVHHELHKAEIDGRTAIQTFASKADA